METTAKQMAEELGEDIATKERLYNPEINIKIGTMQANEARSSTDRAFSKIKYWENVTDAEDPKDLQSAKMILAAEADGVMDDGAKDAVITARDYGIAKGAIIGRLITYTEANTMSNGEQLLKEILYGLWTGTGSPYEGNLNYWIGKVNNVPDSSGGLDIVAGNYFGGNLYGTYYETALGVRPVLIVAKS